MSGPDKDRFFWSRSVHHLLGGGVLGDSLGSLTDCVLGQFTWQEETDCCLDLSAGDGGSLVVVGKAGSLVCDALKDVIHEGVHDRHGLGRDTRVGVHLSQHLVDVDGVGFPPPPLALLVPSTHGLGLGGLFFRSLAGCFGWHVC